MMHEKSPRASVGENGDNPIVHDKVDKANRKPLNDNHRDELRASGLNDATIEASGIYSAEDGAIRNILGHNPNGHSWSVGMVFRYSDEYARVKLDFPRHDKDNKAIKYESPKKTANRAYFPPGFDKSAKSLLITEGEKKALAATQAGYQCIGIPGVWSWQQSRLKDESGRTYGERHLIPDLDCMEWEGCTVYIVFDSDAVSNSGVQLAEARLASVLIDKGAIVRVVRIPASDNDKVGLDDFLVANGIEAFQKLLTEAKPAEKPEAPSVMDWGKQIIDDQFRIANGETIRWWREEFYWWTGCKYNKLPTADLDSGVFLWMDKRMRKTTPRTVTDVRKAVGALSIVRTGKDSPCWLSGNHQTKPENIIAFRNGLLDISNIGGDLTLIDHTPDFFSEVCLEFDFLPEATCPKWEKFLSQVFKDDKELILLLQQYFGLLLTHDTSYQKILFIQGLKRSGKGTIFRLIEHVIGESACVSPTLTSLGESFGLAQLIGKTVCGFPDAHLTGRGNSMGVLELLKSISGEDTLSINRKYMSPVNVRLKTRIILLVNDLPKFNDASLALEARVLLLPTQDTFEGKETIGLTDELKAEAPGILNWALSGLCNLRNTGQFIKPKKSIEMIENYRRAMSPVRAFADDCCKVGDEIKEGDQHYVICSVLYAEWKVWVAANGHNHGALTTFGEKLRVACPGVERRRLQDENKNRIWVYSGISLK